MRDHLGRLDREWGLGSWPVSSASRGGREENKKSRHGLASTGSARTQAGRRSGSWPQEKNVERPVPEIRSIPVNSGHGPSRKSGRVRSLPGPFAKNRSKAVNSGHEYGGGRQGLVLRRRDLSGSGQFRTFPDSRYAILPEQLKVAQIRSAVLRDFSWRGQPRTSGMADDGKWRVERGIFPGTDKSGQFRTRPERGGGVRGECRAES